MTTHFYQILYQDQGAVYRDRLRGYFQQIGNLFVQFDYLFVPIYEGFGEECNLVVVDLNNKVFILFLIGKLNSEYKQDPKENEILIRIYNFLESEYKFQFAQDLSKYNWNYLIGSNSKTSEKHLTSTYLLCFA